LPPVIAMDDHDNEVDESGESYEENATIKAAALAELIKGPALADDSGIEVEALGWGPGVRSARTPRAQMQPAERNEYILRAVAGKSRAARFVSACALVVPGYDPVIGRGEVEGAVAERPAGANGFGYDPIFWYEPYQKTFGEVAAQLKHAVSHRGRAIRALLAKLTLLAR
jgi:XTP/dITP diphosphohydrolase